MFHFFWFQFIVIGFLVALIKKRKSSIDGEVDEDDFDESDEEMVHAWTICKSDEEMLHAWTICKSDEEIFHAWTNCKLLHNALYIDLNEILYIFFAFILP